MKTFSAITSKFEKLLRFLPGGIRKPIEREWTFLKELFLERRAPRIVVVGPDAEAFVSSVLFSHPEDLKLGLVTRTGTRASSRTSDLGTPSVGVEAFNWPSPIKTAVLPEA